MKGKTGILLIGQGLAGSLLAWELIQQGKNVLVVDDQGPAAASPVAAGMINPLAGRRLALYPDTARYLAIAKETYTSLSEVFRRPFFHPSPIWRYFKDSNELERYKTRKEDPDFTPYLGEPLYRDGTPIGFMTQGGGWLDVPGLIEAIRKWLKQSDSLLQRPMDYAGLEVTSNGICWDGIEAERVVFCEGWRGSQNPWFANLPWDPVKGEILRLEAPSMPRDRILNRGKWFVPTGGGGFRAGSTYQRNAFDDQPTQAGRDEVISGLDGLVELEQMEVINHEAGVRPGTRTQHPLMGKHPDIDNITLFNGFGSKGAFLIPNLTKIFCQHLYKGEALPPNMDIRQLWKS